MSIEDESFPKEFLEVDFSPHTEGARFPFPNDLCEKSQNKLTASQSPIKTTTTNISPSSSNDQSLSSRSSTEEQPLPIFDSNTVACNANASHIEDGFLDSTKVNDHNRLKNSNYTEISQQNKRSSFQDIHAEYTRRRFKHVESKVAKYIANLKAEDQKHRQKKFQRHSSLPDTFGGQHYKGGNQHSIHFSADELHRMNESTSDADGEADSSKNTTATTSSSSGGTTATTTTNNSSSNGDRNISDKSALMQMINEKERIQSHNEYLQTRLDEKITENMRLKRNVETMRIELTNCKDKLKQSTSMTSLGSVSMISRLPLQVLLNTPSKCVKGTQTDLKTPPLPQLQPSLYITPDTPDANNNTMFDSGSNTGKAGKSVATIQPLSLNFSNIMEQYSGEGNAVNDGLRQRSNSNSTDPQESNINTNTGTNSSSSCPSSSDSAIDIELASPKTMKLLPERTRSTRSQRREEFIYYDKRSGRYAALPTLKVGADEAFDENDNSNACPEPTKRKTKKHFSLRRRWLRIFGPCTRCQDQNNTLDSSALQQTYTQIPLLEKSFENHCRLNIR